MTTTPTRPQTDLAYRHGAAADPPVLCIHGATLDHHAFAPQIPALLDAGYQVITVDLRGHGQAQPLEGPLHLADVVEDLAALMEELALPRAVLVGQSFGGLVAQQLHRRYPERVAAMLLIGSPALDDRPPWIHRTLSRLRPTLLRLWPERHLRRILPPALSKVPEVRRYVAQASAPIPKAGLVAVTEAALEGLQLAGPQRRTTTPTLVTRGEGEASWVARMMEAWAVRDELVQATTLPEAGHLANLDNPAAFNAAMLPFLQRHQPAPVDA